MGVVMGPIIFRRAHWKPAPTGKTGPAIFVSGTGLLFHLLVEDWDHLVLMTVSTFFHVLCQ